MRPPGDAVILFALPLYEQLGGTLASLAELRPGRASIERFSNLELHTTVDDTVKGRHCLLLGAVAPPDEHLLATLLLA
ncbi:MAG TPA: hypothetical protein VIE37_02050, partial [Methylomirabilota bacterium]